MSVVRRARLSSVLGVLALTAGTLVGVTVAATPASAASNPAPAAGERRSATRLDFGVSGTAKLSVDVGTGNALFTDRLFTLPGVTADVPINLYFNSSVVGSSVASTVTGNTHSGWSITGFDQRLIANSDGSVTYFGPGGLTGVFTPDGAGGFVAPVQFRADLATVSGGGWQLTMPPVRCWCSPPAAGCTRTRTATATPHHHLQLLRWAAGQCGVLARVDRSTHADSDDQFRCDHGVVAVRRVKHADGQHRL